MWQERGKTTHLKVAKKWGKEEREGSSFVLPQLLHHSAVSSWISGLTAAEKCSVPRSVSWCSGPGQQLFLQIRARECSRCPVSPAVSHTCCPNTDSSVYWNVDVYLQYTNIMLSVLFTAFCSEQSSHKESMKPPEPHSVSHQWCQQFSGLIHCLILWVLITTGSLPSSLVLLPKFFCLILRQEKIVLFL